MLEFYDTNSPIGGSTIEDKSEIDIDNDIPLCDICQTIILKPYQDNTKLICPKCGHIYNPHYEVIQIQNQETTIDELSDRGQLTFKNDTINAKKTVNRSSQNLENTDCVNKEF